MLRRLLIVGLLPAVAGCGADGATGDPAPTGPGVTRMAMARDLAFAACS